MRLLPLILCGFAVLFALSASVQAQTIYENLQSHYGEADSCQVNVACTVGRPWFSEIGSVVRYVTETDGTGEGNTATLINTTGEDVLQPYVLVTAHGSGASIGDSRWAWFQFNWQTPTCANPPDPPDFEYDLINYKVALRSTGASNTEDFMLYRLVNNNLSGFDVHYAGWSIEDIQPNTGTMIGHPQGDVKKIVIDDDPITWNSTTWQTQPDIGRLEDRQSGSFLFNEARQMVGLVRWGTLCSPTGPNNPNPKLAHMWDIEYWDDDEGAYFSISDYLDNAGTGATSMPSIANYDLSVTGETFSDSTADFAMGFFRTAASIDVSDVAVESGGGRLHLRARENISITGDFLAEAGSDFLARIEPAPGGGGSGNARFHEVAEDVVPALPQLEQNHPNPFQDRTTFRFSVPEAGRVTLTIYDLLGRKILTLFDAHQEAGTVTLHWSPSAVMGQSLAAGVYAYRLRMGDHAETRTFTILP